MFYFSSWNIQSLMMVDWARMPEELLEMVAKLLQSDIANIVRFASVCKSWRSVVVHNRRCLSSDIPWLFCPISCHEEACYDVQDGPRDQRKNYCLVSLFDNRDYFLSLAEEINQGHSFIGAYMSWLFIACRDETLCLYNPFSRARVSLPSCGIRPGSLSKFVLSANPGEEVDWVLMAIVHAKNLMFCKSGDQAWTSLSYMIPFVDLVYHHDGRLFALHHSGTILVVTFEGHSHSTLEINPEFGDPYPFPLRNTVSGRLIKVYLVSLYGQLLEVYRIGRIEDNQTIAFKVFKLDWSTQSLVSVNHLDDSVLIVSDNYSASLKASEIPGCRGNCIYFIESHNGSSVMFHEMAACYLQDMTVERLGHGRGILDHEVKHLPDNGFWITPSLS